MMIHASVATPVVFAFALTPLLSQEFAGGFWMFCALALLQFASAQEGSASAKEDEQVQAEAIVVVPVVQRVTKIRFAENMQVREYSVTLGDHPLTPSFPLSLDWKHAATKLVPLCDNNFKNRRQRVFTERGRRELLARMAEEESIAEEQPSAEVQVPMETKVATLSPRRSPRLVARKIQVDFTQFFL